MGDSMPSAPEPATPSAPGTTMPGDPGAATPDASDLAVPSTQTVAGDTLDELGTEPPADRPRQRTAWQLRVAGRACGRMGSPLYAHLLERSAADCESGGVVWDVLAVHAAPGRADALALRFMAAVHRLVLEERAPRLAACYPSVGGTADPDRAWPAFAHTLAEHRGTLRRTVGRPCQTNEVGRSAGLAVGFLQVAARAGLPLRLLEVGASAGLNLRWDRFRIGGGGVEIGDPDSPVDLSGHWHVPPPLDGAPVTVVGRYGCDRRPVDPLTTEGRLRLTSSVWADHVDRLDRLRGAIALARDIPAVVDEADVADWTERRLADWAERAPDGSATVVYHAVVLEYLPVITRQRFLRALDRAGAAATPDRPLAWVRLEPVSELRHHGIELTLWPGGDHRVLAQCGAHGAELEWLGDAGPDSHAPGAHGPGGDGPGTHPSDDDGPGDKSLWGR